MISNYVLAAITVSSQVLTRNTKVIVSNHVKMSNAHKDFDIQLHKDWQSDIHTDAYRECTWLECNWRELQHPEDTTVNSGWTCKPLNQTYILFFMWHQCQELIRCAALEPISPLSHRELNPPSWLGVCCHLQAEQLNSLISMATAWMRGAPVAPGNRLSEMGLESY